MGNSRAERARTNSFKEDTLAEVGLLGSVAQQHIKLAHRGLAFNAGAAITAQRDTIPEVRTTTGATEDTAVTTIHQYTAFTNDAWNFPQIAESNASLPIPLPPLPSLSSIYLHTAIFLTGPSSS